MGRVLRMLNLRCTMLGVRDSVSDRMIRSVVCSVMIVIIFIDILFNLSTTYKT